jgi:hypothetical protein
MKYITNNKEKKRLYTFKLFKTDNNVKSKDFKHKKTTKIIDIIELI